MASLRTRVETWIRDQTRRLGMPAWSQPLPALAPPQWRWPPWRWRDDRWAQERAIREEYERRKKQFDDICRAVKADSVADLQEILCSMVLAECVYKRPAADMIRYINKFKSDFGGEIVSLEHVQPSLDHVPHRYLLAEAGDTIYASFIGTKQYKDVIADANIFQGAIFHEDNAEDYDFIAVDSDQVDRQNKSDKNLQKPFPIKQKRMRENSKPAAHRGFLARAKGIPAFELYKLAEKKNRKLVLCGHSLGGAVAVLSTLAILRALASASLNKEHDKIQVKCITFSQPPVGNAALRDYVHQKGWQHYFKTFCIPEDLVPRILSPAYFDHYNAQVLRSSATEGLGNTSVEKHKDETIASILKKPKRNDEEQLVLGLGPVQKPLWRLSRIVPLESIQKHINLFKRVGNLGETLSTPDGGLHSAINETDEEPESLEIKEGFDGISLTPLVDTDRRSVETNGIQTNGKSSAVIGKSPRWRRVPSLPSYVPFGQLYLLGNSSVELLSDAEYSKLTSVRSVIAEIREFFQSHSMKSYRSRFQKIYDTCMCLNASPFLGMEQLPQFPHLQQLLGLTAASAVELGHIVEPPVIQAATSILPLGWGGSPGDKNSEPIKVDVLGFGLHLCTQVHAQVNGCWCSTAIESIPLAPPYSVDQEVQPEMQKMRILIGPPLKRLPKCPDLEDYLATECVISAPNCKSRSFTGEEMVGNDDMNGILIYCTSDFVTICKEVHVRTRRVRLIGLEGAGKTTLFRALLTESRQRSSASPDSMHSNVVIEEGTTGGLCYVDSAGVNLQKLHLELSRFKEELQIGARDLSRKTDLVVLVHNLSHKVPLYQEANSSQPALSLFLDEAKALRIPWVLAITNKFSVSAHQQKMLITSVVEAYHASPNMVEVINAIPFVIPTASSGLQPLSSVDEALSRKDTVQKFVFAPINFARMSFQKKSAIMPVEGVTAFRQLVQRVLASHEEMAFTELLNERLSLEMAREQGSIVNTKPNLHEKGSSITAAAVGASLGAGLGLVMAVVMGAASALRKP